ncbi:hypothetical protein CN419_27790 [Bacillus cereus]|uniref:LCI fold-containing protein n=1 Tax=Bacillus cereus TaxID=1396 RepID=UPI0008FDB2FF|nr:LCI fold-containing protein [Bacillus cereus]MCM3201707.1 hypothetical protein [Bacillus cereus]MDN4100244.1 LCI family antimicrobial peptide [Bacillus cereus]OJE15122.1 hypothetical protein A9488_08375 [Bacillus cereus]PEV23408.1 hypothetical protein CN419_27790 [Bacillus cereus]UDW03864.1 hypothetical protein FHQ13_027870 [Bacillus cereus]
MFKKLVVGALATGIVLTGGVGVASAGIESEYNKCTNSGVMTVNGKFTQYIVQSSAIFDNTFTDKNTKITWYFKGYEYSKNCGKFIGKYEGRNYSS